MFQSLNRVDVNLKPQFLIKSGYYIVPKVGLMGNDNKTIRSKINCSLSP
jgi:hypothetical protein